jgi:hypothetical protein
MSEINNAEKAESPQAIKWTLPLVQAVTQTTEIVAVPQPPQPPPLVAVPPANPDALH